jgi:hypothetical protein
MIAAVVVPGILPSEDGAKAAISVAMLRSVMAAE